MAWFVFLCVGLAVVAGGLILFTALIAALVEGAVPPLGKTVTVEGATFRYLDEGTGPTIVLVHGLAGNLRHFTYALKDRLTPDYRVILFDRPGCGYSTMAPGASPRLPAQAATIMAFLRTLGVEKPLLVGHSLGGALSLAAALDHPDEVGGLALIAPLTHSRDEVPAAFRLLATVSPLRRKLTAWLLATPASMLAGATTLKMIFGPETPPADFGKNGGGLLTVRPNAFIAASAEMVAVVEDLPSMARRYASIKCPVGVLHGTGDRILDYREQGEALVEKNTRRDDRTDRRRRAYAAARPARSHRRLHQRHRATDRLNRARSTGSSRTVRRCGAERSHASRQRRPSDPGWCRILLPSRKQRRRRHGSSSCRRYRRCRIRRPSTR